jgi:hypothetical protein
MNIKHTCTTAYHPQGNAYAERVHKFINHALAQYVNDEQTDWDEIVPALMLSHNDCINIIHGVSPAETILGRHLNLPGFELEDSSEDTYNPKSYAQKLKWVLTKTQEIVQDKMRLKEAQNEIRSAKIKTTQFQVGQAV